MKINDKEIEVDNLLKEEDYEKGMLKDYGNGILLTKNYIEVLSRYNIDYKKYGSINSLMYDIEEYLNDNSSDAEDLEWVASELSERSYYQNTRK